MPVPKTSGIKSRQDAIRDLCVALDVSDASTALSLVDRLAGHVGFFKIGMELFTSEGPEIVRKIIARGEKVFLDLKFHDIPNTVAGAARSAARLGVSILNVHASGGPEMLRAAVQGAREGALSSHVAPPKVIAVTVLTSIDQQTLDLLSKTNEQVLSYVIRLSQMARDAGLDGVVASPEEIRAIRAGFGSDFLIVTPGIRPAGSSQGDQKRVMTPGEAVRAGASTIVIGRPITASQDPVGAAQAILVEMTGL